MLFNIKHDVNKA